MYTVLRSRVYFNSGRPFQWRDAIDREIRIQLELDAGIVLEHPEADGVPAADPLLLGIDADVEVVVQQIVVGAIAAVFAAQELRAARAPATSTAVPGAIAAQLRARTGRRRTRG